MTTQKHDIGIVIVNYNVRHFLTQCLHSVFQSQTNDLRIGVWVVDNASIDGSAEWIGKEFPQVYLIQNSENVGFSKANNQAIRQMDATYVLLLNPDTVLEEHTLQKCFEFMSQHKEAGALGVRMIDGSGRFLPESKRKIPDLWSSFCKLSYLSDLFPRSKWFSGYNLGHLHEMKTHEIEVLCGAFMLMRKEALDQVGLLDEAFFMYGEDIDLSYRIIQGGWKIFYYPETSIIHYKGESTKKSSINYIKTFYGAMSIYVNKHYSSGNAKIFAKVINVAIFIRALISGLGKIMNSLLRPFLDLVILFVIMYFLKDIWAEWYFQNQDYYEFSPISSLLILYSFVWIGTLWIGGHYDYDRKWLNTLQYSALGTIIILMIYALLPTEYRTSRALILIGALTTIIVAGLTSMVYHLLTAKKISDDEPVHIAIVAEKQHALRLSDSWKNVNKNASTFSYISPLHVDEDPFYTNSFYYLPKVVEKLKVDEIIFSADAVSMKDIIQVMTSLHTKVKYRISHSDSLILLGSHDKNTKGELLNLDMNYNLGAPALKRLKRVIDLVVSVLMLPFSPIIYVLTGLNHRFLTNIFNVVMGQKTWIGYSGAPQDFGFLPELPKAVISYTHTQKLLEFTPSYFKTQNIEYAQNYTLIKDISLILKNIHKVSD